MSDSVARGDGPALLCWDDSDAAERADRSPASPGRTSEIIATLAEERGALMIVMGRPKRSSLGRLLLGSVAREVLGLHERPVMLVGPTRPRA